MDSVLRGATRARWFSTRTTIESILIGVTYGVLLRGITWIGKWVHFHLPTYTYAVMTVGFLFVGPTIMGFLVVRRAAAVQQLAVSQWVLLPWITTGLTCLATAIFALEGSICILFALPAMLFCSTVGGVTAGLLARKGHTSSPTLTTCLAMLPILIALIEPHFNAPVETRKVSSTILIHASAGTVWHNVERVPTIAPAELRTTWAQRIGFPRPVEATLSYEGLGGIRHASFERGLLFIETVTAWEPEQRIAFSIRADTAHIPPTTLDEHVTIGGPYFDVLDGEYTLEALANGTVLLHLTSHQRLSTDFNGYAALWSDAVMQNLQSSILKVIQHRCEHA